MIVTAVIGLLLLLGIVGALIPWTDPDTGQRVPFKFRAAGGAIPVLIGLVILGFAGTAIIQAKNVGVLTTFGKPAERTLSPGLHFKAPWQKVTELDGTTISDEYRGDRCITVRIGDGSTACISATNRWRLVQEKANITYGDYRSDDVKETVRDALVSTVFKASVNQVLGEYDPTGDLQVIDAKAGASADFAPDYDAISEAIQSNMRERVKEQGSLVEIRAVTVSYIKLSDSTQNKINAYQAEVAETRNALQRKETASAQAEANRALSESVSNDPNVLVSKCFDTLAAMVELKQPIPAGFSCWPGGGSAVVIPSGATK